MMIKNDLPQGTLKESKYQKSKKTLKTIGICMIVAGIVVSGAIVATNINSDTNKADSKASTYDQLLAKEKTTFNEKQETARTNADRFKTEAEALANKIDAEKQAVLPDYDLVSFAHITDAQNVELARIDRNYQSEIDAMDQRASEIGDGISFDCQIRVKCKVTDSFGQFAKITTGKEFDPNFDGSAELIELKMDADSAEFMADNGSIMAVIIPAAMPLILLCGLGGILLLFAHQRETAAFAVQGALPVMSEATGKMVKSLDDNGTLDIIAKTGAKMTARSAKYMDESGAVDALAKVEAKKTSKTIKHLKDDGTLDTIAETGAKIMGTAPKSQKK